jgi:RsiW-degrading membrane proteinase PrsW (M82 family)
MNEVTRNNFWRSGLAALAGLFLFVIIMGWIPQPEFQGPTLLAIGLLLALVPAFLWFIFFFQQNRKSPEPKRTVWRVLLFSGLLASGAGLPLVDQLFSIQEWLQGNPWLKMLGLVLIIGFTQEFLKFMAIRYTVFPTTDFRSRVDGMIFGIAAGLGYATVLNVAYVLSNKGVLLRVGSMHMIVTALAQAGFAAITGYFLASAKYGERPPWWVPTGLGLAAVSNGIFTHLRNEITVRGLTYNPLNAMLLALGFVLLTLSILFVMMRRAERPYKTHAAPEEPSPHTHELNTPWEQSLRYDTMVIGVLIIALALGGILKGTVEGARVPYSSQDGRLSLEYPASWTSFDEKETLLTIRDLRSEGAFKVSLWVKTRELPLEGVASIRELITPYSVEKGEELTGFRVLSIEEHMIANLEAVEISYVYIDTPVDSGSQLAIPVVVKGVDVLSLYHNSLFAFTFVAPADSFSDETETLQAFLSSVSFE